MSKTTTRFYNRFSIFYPLADLFLRPQKRILFREINSLEFGKLLEIGVGNGSHLKLYKTHTITAIDTSWRMLHHAKKRKTAHIELIQMDGESLLFQHESFDYIILSHVIAVVDNPEKLLEEAYRVLKKGGKILILNHFTPSNGFRYLDKSFQFFSKKLHFKSVFHVSSLHTLKKFTLVKEVHLKPCSYFKLLIYIKL